jgi:hypothetical protein
MPLGRGGSPRIVALDVPVLSNTDISVIGRKQRLQ